MRGGPVSRAGRFAIGLTIFVLSTGFIVREASARLSTEEFVSTPAARAFADERYEDALAGFRALRERHPNDVTLIRYIGITLYRLGRYRDAADALREAIEIDPNNAAAHYFLGPVLIRLGDREGAIAAFRRARDLAPDTPYARKAARYLEGLGQASDERRPAPGERRWEAHAQLGIQYDDNVRAAPDRFPADVESFRAFEYLAGEYRVLERDAWGLTVEGTTYHSQHFDGDLDRFNLTALSGGARADYATEIGSIPTRFEAGYRLRAVWLDYSLFSTKHFVTTGATLRFSERYLGRAYYEFRVRHFRRDGFRPAISSRDGIANIAGLKLYRFIGERRHYLWVGYEFRHIGAEGRSFDSFAHEVSVGGTAHLPWDLRLDASIAYTYADYPGFVGLRGRETNRLLYNVTVSRKLTEQAAVSVSYERTDEMSSIASLEYDRNVVTVAFDYSF